MTPDDREIRVRNIDVSCDEHPEAFAVNWDGNEALSIKPAESAVVPEWLGRHYAKKLAEHLLVDKSGYSAKDFGPNADRLKELEAEIIEDAAEVKDSGPERIPKGHGHVVDPSQQ